MTRPEIIMEECERRNIVLEHGGEKLLVTPVDNTTPELMEQLRQHKFEILEILESRKQAALHLLKQITHGEFLGCDDKTRRAIASELRALPSEVAKQALKQL